MAAGMCHRRHLRLLWICNRSIGLIHLLVNQSGLPLHTWKDVCRNVEGWKFYRNSAEIRNLFIKFPNFEMSSTDFASEGPPAFKHL